MQQGLKSGSSPVEFVIYAPHRVQRSAGVGLLHRSVELPLERLDVVLVVHLMALSISPLVRMTRHGVARASYRSHREGNVQRDEGESAGGGR